MSALTFVLNELPGVDPEEFRNVRSYHSCGKMYQEAVKSASGKMSPTGSTSSGFGSLADEDITKLVNSQELLKDEGVKKRFKIMFGGRDILNLERNTQPHKWQLSSPIYGFLNASNACHYQTYYRTDGNKLVEEYETKACGDCEFCEPTPYPSFDDK